MHSYTQSREAALHESRKLRYQLVVWFAIFQHISWGLMLFASADPTHVTAIYTAFGLIHNRQVLATVFLVVGLMALWSMRHSRTNRRDLFFAMPQQFILILSAAGAIDAILSGRFGDGAAYSRWFIGADQLAPILLAGLHTICLWRVFAPRPDKSIRDQSKGL